MSKDISPNDAAYCHAFVALTLANAPIRLDDIQPAVDRIRAESGGERHAEFDFQGYIDRYLTQACGLLDDEGCLVVTSEKVIAAFSGDNQAEMRQAASVTASGIVSAAMRLGVLDRFEQVYSGLEKLGMRSDEGSDCDGVTSISGGSVAVSLADRSGAPGVELTS